MARINKHKTVRLLFALLALALVAAACGSDDDSDTETSAEEATTEATPAEEAPTEEGTEAPTEEPTEAPTEEATEAPTEEPELTASYRGVTEDTIKIGVVLFDLDAILELGVDVGYGDQTQHVQLAIDELNAAGGILGRQVEAVYRTISPVDPVESDQACIELTEDEEVFLVVGTQRPAENVLCYTQLADTPFIGTLAGVTDSVFADSLAPLLLAQTAPERANDSIYAAMELEDAIEGGVIGLYGNEQERLDTFEQGLLDRGASEVVKTLRTAPEADQQALATEIDVVVERYRSDGVTAVVNLGNNVAFLAGFERNGYSAPVWTNGTDVLADFFGDQGATDEQLMLVRLVVPPSADDLYLAGHEATVECVDRWNTARPDEPAIPYAGEDDLSNIGVLAIACANIEIFELAATAAGPELTVESLTAGLDEVGDIDVSYVPIGSLSSSKWDANDGATIYTWDDAEGRLVAGEVIDIG